MTGRMSTRTDQSLRATQQYRPLEYLKCDQACRREVLLPSGAAARLVLDYPLCSCYVEYLPWNRDT